MDPLVHQVDQATNKPIESIAHSTQPHARSRASDRVDVPLIEPIDPTWLNHFPLSLSHFAILSVIFQFQSVILLHHKSFHYNELNHFSIVLSHYVNQFATENSTIFCHCAHNSAILLYWTQPFCYSAQLFLWTQPFVTLLNHFMILSFMLL
jgi:hypothetical protein